MNEIKKAEEKIMGYKTDIEIAQEAVLAPIEEIASKLDISRDELEFYGKYKAKISDEYIERTKNNKEFIQMVKKSLY